MLHTFKLLLPALIPSWNFFDIIAPSPRIQYTLLSKATDTPDAWQLSRPLPEHVSFRQMLGRLLWNPYWNESLFMMSCAERLLDYPTRHSEDEILKRIARDVLSSGNASDTEKYLQFRIMLLSRVASTLVEDLAYESRVLPLSDFIKKKDHEPG